MVDDLLDVARVTQGKIEPHWEIVDLRALLRLSLIHISEPHETVLDLVCRLLLEKKKQSRKRTTANHILRQSIAQIKYESVLKPQH